jgi:hypothetical protein
LECVPVELQCLLYPFHEEQAVCASGHLLGYAAVTALWPDLIKSSEQCSVLYNQADLLKPFTEVFTGNS